jgi:hypothetical protein
MSERRRMVTRFETFLNDIGLNEVYGVIVKPEGRVKTLTFCKARILDASVNIYGMNFIQVKWQTGIRALAHEDARVFTTEANAMAFIRAAFVDFDFATAEAVPTKAPTT